MRPSLPQLDLHAHVEATIPARELEGLGAVVFVATRSLDEFQSTQKRRDAVTVWGVGCHPGDESAQRAFDRSRFAELVRQTAFVSEVGLEGRSKVSMAEQEKTLHAVLGELTGRPRIVSIHSSGAPGRVLDALARIPIRGAVLHWWRGTPPQTARAVELGCWFSVNAAGAKHAADVARIPLDRILTETDHPSGDRTSAAPRQPGAVQDVEESLAATHGMSAANIRRQVWVNFSQLVRETGVTDLLPIPVQRMVEAAGQR
ncbi:TatD family hydrolase [Cryobacterium sp. BB736]|uniref:TatD family hydrolase n=1 Tax=Cryobacterium sp. BB736 TaxID=2746963 RepID=UPI00187532E2|nr:TatD family hydrolase [Cryobacterium sp. BB736]